MMVSNRGSFVNVLLWQWRYCCIFLVAGALAWVLHDVAGYEHLVLPAPPAAILGAALGIFASFRANAAYARWWEGRQLWGKLTNASRMLASQVGAYVDDEARRQRVLLRHVLWVHVLRVQLRDDDVFADEHVKRVAVDLGLDLSSDDGAALKAEPSLAHALLDQNLKTLTQAGLDPQRLHSLDATIATLLDVQGGSERLKRTPMPRSYGFFVERLMVIFSFLFPFAIVEQLSWVTMPVNLVVCLGFTLISETGRVLEDPFTHFYNSLPLTNMSINVERNVRQRLGPAGAPLPPAVTVDAQGILW
jgi:putative membrane protein